MKKQLALLLATVLAAIALDVAAFAAVAIAEKLIDQHPDPVAEVLQKAVDAEDEEVAGKTQRLLRLAKDR